MESVKCRRFTIDTLVVAFGEEKHSFGGPLGSLEEALSIRILAQRAEKEPVATRHLGQESFSGGWTVVQFQVMMECALFVTCNKLMFNKINKQSRNT